MARKDYKGREMPAKVEQIYDNLDSIKNIQITRMHTHKEAYIQGMNALRGDNGMINYEILNDEGEREKIIEKWVDNKMEVYRNRAKQEYGISREKEEFKDKPSEDLDDFVLRIYTGKDKKEMKRGIQKHLETDPVNFNEQAYHSLMVTRYGRKHDELVQSNLYRTVLDEIKDEDHKAIFDYLNNEGIDKIVYKDFLREEDFMKLLQIYDKGRNEITREAIMNSYEETPPFLKPSDYKEPVKEKELPKNLLDTLRPISEKEEIGEKIKKNEISPEKASEMALENPEVHKEIEELSRSNQLKEGFKTQYEMELEKKQQENFREAIKRGDITGEEAALKKSGKNDILERVIQKMAQNQELSEEFIKQYQDTGEKIERDKEKEQIIQGIRRGQITPDKILEAIEQYPRVNEVFKELWDENQIPEEFAEDFNKLLMEKNQENK